MAKKIFLTIILFILAAAVFSQAFPRSNYLPLVEKQASQVVITLRPVRGDAVYFIHYRTEGMKNFQIRKMKPELSGIVSHRILTENLYGRNIEYFVVEERADGSRSESLTHTVANFTKKESPEIYFQSNDAPASQGGGKWHPPVNVNASLSTSTKLSERTDSGYYQQNYTANGNLRIFRNISKNDYQLDFDTNFVHLDPWNVLTEKRINLSSMMLRFKKKNLQFEAGDVSVNQTEFTTSYLNRRGLRFEMNGESLYLNAFLTNSQQKTGFDGYGIPAAKAGIFGAVAGVNLKNTIKIRGMFMTGKDNLDSKTISSNQNPYRNGDMFSLWGEMGLLKNRMQVAGEISASNYGSAQSKEDVQKERDTAWKAGIKYNQGILSFNADYEEIGDHFNSIANLFLQNDREGLSTNLGLNIKTLSLNVSYIDKKNYIHSLVQDMLHQKRAGATANWGLGSHFRLGADVSRDNLDYDSSTGLQTSSSDMNTYNFSASFGYIAGANGLNLNVGKTESVNFTSNLNASLALNLRFGQLMTLNPTLSYQENENLGDGSKSTIYNVYLNSEITLIPNYFTLTLSTSYMNNKNVSGTSSNWSANANLNFFAAKLFKDKVRPSMSLKSQFQGSKYGDNKTDSTIFWLQADIAF
jgi:hypothetical protein